MPASPELGSEAARPESYQQARHDGYVRQVENRPPAQIDEIDDATVSQDVEQVPCGAAKSQAQSKKRSFTLEPNAGVAQQDGGGQRRKPCQQKRDPPAVARAEILPIRDAPDSHEGSP